MPDHSVCLVLDVGLACWHSPVAPYLKHVGDASVCVLELVYVGVLWLRFALIVFVFFFFSSRRRHTRLVSDWSSDVCSSDLRAGRASGPPTRGAPDGGVSRVPRVACIGSLGGDPRRGDRLRPPRSPRAPRRRSEERRVGKECRSRWSPYH